MVRGQVRVHVLYRQTAVSQHSRKSHAGSQIERIQSLRRAYAILVHLLCQGGNLIAVEQGNTGLTPGDSDSFELLGTHDGAAAVVSGRMPFVPNETSEFNQVLTSRTY